MSVGKTGSVWHLKFDFFVPQGSFSSNFSSESVDMNLFDVIDLKLVLGQTFTDSTGEI